jgi:hypothetical protein
MAFGQQAHGLLPVLRLPAYTVPNDCVCEVQCIRENRWLSSAMKETPARAIQEPAGHQDLTMTQRHMRVSPAALNSAIRFLNVHDSAWGRGGRAGVMNHMVSAYASRGG